MEDFEELIQTFAKQMRVRFSTEAVALLQQHSWPGNIRELKNLVARASAYFPNSLIEKSQCSYLLHQTTMNIANLAIETMVQTPDPRPMSLIKQMEKQMILKSLTHNRGNQRRTSKELGMPKSTLHDRIKSYDINVRDFRA